MTHLGVRWVRALMLDPELRADWETWLAERKKYVDEQGALEYDAVKLRWLQGRQQELLDIAAFIDVVMIEHKKATVAADA
jgi:hypothetical protein